MTLKTTLDYLFEYTWVYDSDAKAHYWNYLRKDLDTGETFFVCHIYKERLGDYYEVRDNRGVLYKSVIKAKAFRYVRGHYP